MIGRLRRLTATLGAAATLALWSTAASAATMIATYTGFVNYGVDHAGVFAAPETDLVGQRFTAFYRYDTALGYLNEYGAVHEILGGANFGSYVTPILDAWITVNGVTYNFLADTAGLISLDAGYGVRHTAFQNNGNGGDILALALWPVAAPSSLTSSFNGDVPGGLAGGSIAQVVPSSTPGTPSTILNLTVEQVSVASAVPEPATWGMLIIGFGLIGVGIRRRRATKFAGMAYGKQY